MDKRGRTIFSSIRTTVFGTVIYSNPSFRGNLMTTKNKDKIASGFPTFHEAWDGSDRWDGNDSYERENYVTDHSIMISRCEL